MFDIGFLELALLFVVGLVVLGPERLPRVAKTIGGYLRKARQTWSTLRHEIEQELAADEIRKSIEAPRKEIDALKRQAEQSIKPAEPEAKKTVTSEAADEPVSEEGGDERDR